MTKRSALDLIDDWLATGFTSRRGGLEEPDPVADAITVPARGAAAASAADLRRAELEAVAADVEECSRCVLSMNRTKAVPGEGAIDPPVLFVGEGPGEEEDRTGRPFVGAAGRYLDKWIAAVNLDRRACFIANCVKCRPPQNREPHPDEIAACLPYLERQIAALAPRAIVCLGRIAAQTLLATSTGVGALRKKVHDRKGIPLVATYHPSAVLRDRSLRAPVWEDLKRLKALLAHG
jgi:uracil-DNA glycosylase family 4